MTWLTSRAIRSQPNLPRFDFQPLEAGEIARLAEDEVFVATARDAADQSLRKLMRILAEDGDRKTPLRPETSP